MFNGANKIKVKCICLFWRGDQLLVSDSYDEVKQDHFHRPIGGTVEFGEHAQATLIREMREELNAEITQVRHLWTLENLFTCDGLAGHEINFIFTAEFCDDKFYAQDRFFLTEDDGAQHPVLWVPIKEFLHRSRRFVPEVLLEKLRELNGDYAVIQPAVVQSSISQPAQVTN